MVDVTQKLESERWAVARGELRMSQKTFEIIKAGQLKKGDVFTVAQVAGIMAAKRTAELIPLCHPLPLSHVQVDFKLHPEWPGIEITANVRTSAKTGVEMEAMTAVAMSALTLYDMAKAVEKGMRIQNIRLIEKHGGKSGDVILEVEESS